MMFRGPLPTIERDCAAGDIGENEGAQPPLLYATEEVSHTCAQCDAQTMLKVFSFYERRLRSTFVRHHFKSYMYFIIPIAYMARVTHASHSLLCCAQHEDAAE
jgi:hypothetical protein